MVRKVKFALIGAGNRGKDTYARIIHKEKLNAEFIAVVDPDGDRRQNMMDWFNIDPALSFDNEEEFFNRGKLCDAVIIATQDNQHYKQSMRALELGYHIILEKPISTNIKEILNIEAKAMEVGRQVLICHVLRYAPMWVKIKRILDSGKLGKIMTINHNENIGHYHMSHSFVRGHWRDSHSSGPITLTKTCHDMDILYWLVGSKCRDIASFGNTSFFDDKNAPEDSTEYCFDCPHKEKCEYSGMRVYTLEGGHYPDSFTNNDNRKETIEKCLQETNYGKCVWKAGNNVCDQQVSILQFENGVTANFNINAFTRHTSRTIKIMCEKGEIRANEKAIEVTLFKLRKLRLGVVGNFILGHLLDFLKLDRSIRRRYKVNSLFNMKNLVYEHGGADYYFIKGAIEALMKEESAKTAISGSVESHLMSFVAEEARVRNTVVALDDYRGEIMDQA